jgi:hypothetical protein
LDIILNPYLGWIVAEFFHDDILQHIADASMRNTEGLSPILQDRGRFPSGAAELLQQVLSEPGIRCVDLNRHDRFFAVSENGSWRSPSSVNCLHRKLVRETSPNNPGLGTGV